MTLEKPDQSEEATDHRLAAIDQMAASLGDIVVAREPDDQDNFFAADEQLATLENELKACPGYSAEQTAVLRQQVNKMAQSLASLYTSEGYGNAIPENTQAALEQGVGNRLFVVDTDTFLALRKALGRHHDAEKTREVERQWIEDPDYRWGGEMISAGRIILLRDLSEYSWPSEENGPVAHADALSDRRSPVLPHDGWRSIAGERYAARAVTEEMVHIFLDASLSVVVQEVIAKAITADLLIYVGEDHALDESLQQCHECRDALEARHNKDFHALARLGFDNLRFMPNSRTALIEQIERDAQALDLLGKPYHDLFGVDEQDIGYARSA